MSRATLNLNRLLLMLLPLLLCPATVWSQVDTTQSVAFGDSLTDNDSLFLLFGTDPEIYGADPFEAVFNKAAAETDQLTNYAVLGSTSSQVLDQVLSYALSRLQGTSSPATLISLQAGGNDLLTEEILFSFAAAPPGKSKSADRFANDIRCNLLSSLMVLRFVDRKADVVIWTIPDVTLTPYVLSYGLDAKSQKNVRLHIERLNGTIRALGRSRNVVILDIADVLTEVALDPPTILGVPLTPPPAFGFGAAIFADPIHPTAVSNGLLANELIENLNRKFDDNIPFYSDAELVTLIGMNP